MIVLSVGPYNAVPAERLGIPEDEWIAMSDKIRKYHECTHFVCRRLYPEKREAIWDELVADAVGIYAAFGKYDPRMEEMFLGIKGGRYIGGRLENYLKDIPDEEKNQLLTELPTRITLAFDRFSRLFSGTSEITPFEAAKILEREKEALWG